MSTLNPCPHCGHAAEYALESGRIFAGCGNTQVCGIRTPAYAADVEYAAKQKVAAIWNNTVPDEWPAWQQPSGPADAYALNAKVSHQGARYSSLVDFNVWEPGVANWREVGG